MTETKPTIAITGANKGIGLAIAQQLAAEGYGIAALVRQSSDALDAVMKQGTQHARFPMDLADDQSVTEAARNMLAWAGKPAGLVNCAGVATGGLFTMTRVSDMRKLFDINFFGQLALTQYVAKKMMRAKAGSIVNIASTAALLADAGTVSYGSSKAALIHATRVMATELGNYNIRVNAIAPSVVETEMGQMMDEKSRHRLDERSAIPGVINPEDIANLVSFLLSDQSAKITGQVLRVDRGMPF